MEAEGEFTDEMQATLHDCVDQLGLRDRLTVTLDADEGELEFVVERYNAESRRQMECLQSNGVDGLSLSAPDQSGYIHLEWSSEEASSHAAALADRLGLSGRRDAVAGELSGGEAQRVNLARSVIGPVSLLLADEPTAALDEANGHEVCQLIAELTSERDLCSIVVSHDATIKAYASDSMTMHDGHLEGASVGA